MKRFKIKNLIALMIMATIITVGGIQIYKGIKETRELKQYNLTQVDKERNLLTKESVVSAIKNCNRLEILQKEFTKDYKIKEDNFFSNKSKNITLEGVASYYIDLTNINESNVVVNPNSNSIQLYISQPSVRVEFKNKSYSTTEKSLFAFGDIELTTEQYDKIETTIKNEVLQEMQSNMDEANDRVQGAIKEVLETLTKTKYKVEVNFVR